MVLAFIPFQVLGTYFESEALKDQGDNDAGAEENAGK